MMPRTRLPQIAYAMILCAYFVIGTLFAWRTPDWQAPDEPAHYNYVAQVAKGDWLPEIEMGDWDNALLERLKAEDFAPELLEPLPTVQYEDHQPPLYYWLSMPVYRLTDGNLNTLRMVSVVLGGLTVMLSFAITQMILPEQPYFALAVMAFVAFLPQQMHMTSTVNNDALAGVMGVTTLYVLIRYLEGRHASWHLGLLLGVIFLTKTTIYFMAGVVLLAVWLRWRKQANHNWMQLGVEVMQLSFIAAIFALPYWGRNLMVYGFPDFLGLQRHDSVVVGQIRTADWIEQVGLTAYLQSGAKTTFHSFFGQFGWMEARLGDAIPLAIWSFGILLLIAFVGLLRVLWQSRASVRGWGLLFACMVFLTALQYVFYNLSFVQFQGRYLFSALIPIAFSIMMGLNGVRIWLFGDRELTGWALLMLGFPLLATLDLYLIWRVIPGAVGGI